MKKLLILLLALGLASTAWAAVKPLMDQLLEQVFILKPFIVSEASFTDAANAATIAGALNNMVALSKEVNHEETIHKSGFQVPGSALTEQLEDVANIFNKGNKDYAHDTLRSTLGVCMSCHTQLPAVSTKFTTLNQTQALENAFAEAEFLYLIRNFDDALTMYLGLIQGYPANNMEIRDLEKALYRQILYYVRVARDLQGLSVTLQRDSMNQKLPKHLQTQIAGFIAAVDGMANDPYPHFGDKDSAALRTFAEKALHDARGDDFSLNSPANVIAAAKLSSVLYEYLMAYPDTILKPDILYWLSQGERRYDYQLVHALPDLYLKQCVLEYPQNPIAKKCFARYADSITVAFTGSGGTHIPADVSQELEMMRELVGAD